MVAVCFCLITLVRQSFKATFQRPFHSPVIVYLQYAKTSEGGMIPVMTSDINVYIEGRRGPQMKECI